MKTLIKTIEKYGTVLYQYKVTCDRCNKMVECGAIGKASFQRIDNTGQLCQNCIRWFALENATATI